MIRITEGSVCAGPERSVFAIAKFLTMCNFGVNATGGGRQFGSEGGH
jgi:hypothetical protein